MVKSVSIGFIFLLISLNSYADTFYRCSPLEGEGEEFGTEVTVRTSVRRDGRVTVRLSSDLFQDTRCLAAPVSGALECGNERSGFTVRLPFEIARGAARGELVLETMGPGASVAYDCRRTESASDCHQKRFTAYLMAPVCLGNPVCADTLAEKSCL